MFLLKSIDLVALVSLLVQAVVAWVFVAIQRTLTRREGAARAFVDFQWAFFALAVALSVLCARFFQAGLCLLEELIAFHRAGGLTCERFTEGNFLIGEAALNLIGIHAK